VAVSRLTELPGRLLRELWRELRGLRGHERLAVTGAAVIVLSFLLPWYGLPVAGDPLSQTGFGAFSFAEGALVLVCAAVGFLALQVGGGYVPPRPLTEWALFSAAGVWAALIIGYRMIDRPELDIDLDLIAVTSDYSLRYGIFVALGGAVLIVAAGMQSRRKLLARRARERDDADTAPGGG
jgi:hypothetical protein